MRWPNLSLSVPDAPPAPIHALRSLAVFAEAPSDEHTRIGAALGFDVVPSPAQYSDIFLFQLYPYGSVYLGPEGMMGGVARERIAGFWHAVGLTPPPEPETSGDRRRLPTLTRCLFIGTTNWGPVDHLVASR